MIELTITHDGRRWIATRGETPFAAARTIEGLDRGISRKLRGRAGRKGRTRVFMAFDRSVIPQWMRQYSQHYFNRMITV